MASLSGHPGRSCRLRTGHEYFLSGFLAPLPGVELKGSHQPSLPGHISSYRCRLPRTVPLHNPSHSVCDI